MRLLQRFAPPKGYPVLFGNPNPSHEPNAEQVGKIEGKTTAKHATKPTTVREDEEVAGETGRVKVSNRQRGKNVDDGPRTERISDGKKAELESLGWLKKRLPSAEHRRDFMKWLQKGHTEDDHEHLSPGSREANRMLEEWSQESGVGLNPE